MNNSAYGSGWFSTTLANLKDRFSGDHARANARLGFVKQPPGAGSKLLWIKAGATPESLRLGVELMGAIRQKRLDVRIVLTFEEEYPELLEKHLSGLKNIGLGFGPCDRPSVVKRILDRWSPFGLIVLEAERNRHLIELAEEKIPHVIAYGSDPASAAVEAAYPFDQEQYNAWHEYGLTDFIAEPAHPRWLFTESQADTTLKSIVNGGAEHSLFWVHQTLDLQRFISDWKNSSWRNASVLFISGEAVDYPKISTWKRNALDAGSVIYVDDPAWYTALASAADAIHVNNDDVSAIAYAASGGTAMSVSSAVADADKKLGEVVSVIDSYDELYKKWTIWSDQPMVARRTGDACRRLFWERRRHIQAVNDELLQRVFDW